MIGDIENPMVLDAHWRHLEREEKVFGECAGCGEDIYGGEDYYEFEANKEVLMVHQNGDCCRDFVANMSRCRTAGE